jgi:hypothetical protein
MKPEANKMSTLIQNTSHVMFACVLGDEMDVYWSVKWNLTNIPA